MRILILGDSNSPHIIKLAKSLYKEGMQIIIFSLTTNCVDDYDELKNIQIVSANFAIKRNKISIYKIKYLKSLVTLKKIINKFKPDILHAHYASSYGFLGALTRFHPFILSVWGSDIYYFPKKSYFHKKLIQYVLNKADRLLSTSNAMKKETLRYTNKIIEVTPFGVDLEEFKPMQVNSMFNSEDIIIGTIKTLEKIYGIDYLIKSFKIISEKYPNLPLKLLIVGDGSQRNLLKNLVKFLNLENKVIFTGKIKFKDVPKYYNMISIFVIPSLSESFGVAGVEALACEVPVIASNVGGLSEVIEDNKTGFLVPPKDIIKLADAIEKLILDDKLRKNMGKYGRIRVSKFFNWNENVNEIIKIYYNIYKYP